MLADPARHDGKRYRPTGPELLSVAEMAVVLERVLAREVRAVPMPFWLFAKAARMQGVAAFDLAGFRDYIEDHRQGAFARGAPSDDVRAVTGRPAESFEETARRYAARPDARRSTSATIRAVFDFLRTPLMPGYDIDRYARTMRFPVPPKPSFAMDDPRWLAAHDGERESAAPPSSKPAVAAA